MKNNPVTQIESPYPIDVSILYGDKFLVFKLLKLTGRGFIADTGGVMLKVASTIPECTFTLPTNGIVISGSLRVIKNYDKPTFSNNKIQDVQRLTELHFQNLTDWQRQEIRNFLTQVKPAAT